VSIKNNDFSKAFWDIAGTIITTILFVGILLFFMSRMSGGGMGGPMAFIKSRAKVYDPDADEQVTFADVAGSEEEKSDLEEVVDFLKNPTKYKDLGAKIPRGILLQ
jgi:cell division protease FtsH